MPEQFDNLYNRMIFTDARSSSLMSVSMFKLCAYPMKTAVKYTYTEQLNTEATHEDKPRLITMLTTYGLATITFVLPDDGLCLAV